MAKILVTGGNGFLGRWLVRRLCRDGHEVTCLLRSANPIDGLSDLKYSIVKGDVTDRSSVMNAVRGHEHVFHLAGLVAYRKVDRIRMDEVNVGGTENVIDACLSYQVQRLLHVSSVVAVGASFDGKQPLTEESPYNVGHLDMGYFESKHAAEVRVKQAVQDRKLSAVIVNPATTYGAGDALKGSRNIQIKVARGKLPFYTTGGVNVIPVENCIEGMMLAWQKGRIGERYLLSGENLTIQELFTLIAKAAGVPPPRYKMPETALHFLGRSADFLNRLGFNISFSVENAWTASLFHWFDNSKAKRELGFRVGSTEDAIRASVGWMKTQGLI